MTIESGFMLQIFIYIHVFIRTSLLSFEGTGKKTLTEEYDGLINTFIDKDSPRNSLSRIGFSVVDNVQIFRIYGYLIALVDLNI